MILYFHLLSFWFLGMCSLGGNVYCIGGTFGQAGNRHCYRLLQDESKWERISSLHTGKLSLLSSIFSKHYILCFVLRSVPGCGGNPKRTNLGGWRLRRVESSEHRWNLRSGKERLEGWTTDELPSPWLRPRLQRRTSLRHWRLWRDSIPLHHRGLRPENQPLGGRAEHDGVQGKRFLRRLRWHHLGHWRLFRKELFELDGVLGSSQGRVDHLYQAGGRGWGKIQRHQWRRRHQQYWRWIGKNWSK